MMSSKGKTGQQLSMNWLVYHIVSGHAFFSGLLLLLVAAGASTRSKRLYQRLAVVTGFVGCVAIVVSSTAILSFVIFIAVVVALLALIACFKKRLRTSARFGVVLLAIVGAAFELPYHFQPTLNATNDRKVTVIGDSVTAGVGSESETWPKILARENNYIIQDISHVGETAASALKRARKHRIESSIVFIEIGGNDILGTTTPPQFHRDLDALLSHLTEENRQLVMFELPLPPFYHQYGYIQRKLAAKYDVRLIPKGVFLSVIAGNESTLDSIHLTQAGHQLMANSVADILSSAFPE